MLNVSIDSFGYSEKEILKDIHFKLNAGEHLAILGESGCGKSTVLHLVYGLLHLNRGSIHWDNTLLLGPTHHLIPGETFMKLVAQEFNVMPFITVAENIATHLSRLDSDKDAVRVQELLTVVDLIPFENTLVKNLSGGQKQRVALAKALANEPKLLLLDEPFSNIDTFRKNKLRRNLFNYLKENKIMCITATHDSDEALAFADRILLLRNGQEELCGTPETVFSNLKTAYQKGFFGEVTILPSDLFSSETASEELVLLPHQLVPSKATTKLEVTVKKAYFRGHYYLIEATWNTQVVFFIHSEELEPNTTLFLQKQ
ncbi:ABC transporter ATP-binding protein [Ulvibacter litoralis]|uniref:ABC-type Fe3+/spermidine/putrescine transport systems, ATPase components n=1 Tax=Ulvibacter litoralis TaxID=227084 RepID=A0A1G7DCC0_9FLAO|nr:ABC transporter ATP-binding protein [Ulvibacter litoralis]GHC43993.1 ABC transporter ATP-binding protein [Ulvibacter litoralis]SDE49254.1 ABC-type Fe3+/spermidine/putrescine transport systems, ATPase components [Ulvibacter litoralis]